MTKPLLCFLSLGVVLSAQAPVNVQQPFVGHWRLVSFVSFDQSGASRPSQYTDGRIRYDAAGHMAAQLMASARKPFSTPATEAERAAAYSSYIAYYGTYTVDASAGKVTHHVEGSVNPNWVKTDLVRWYSFSDDGNRLMLSVKNGDRVTSTLTWERVR